MTPKAPAARASAPRAVTAAEASTVDEEEHAEVTPLPVLVAPAAPAPVTPLPVLVAPAAPAPVTPLPVLVAPAAPAPVTPQAPPAPAPAADDDDVPLGISDAPGSIDKALEMLGEQRATEGAPPPYETMSVEAEVEADQAALLATFEALAVEHVRPIRDLMMEVRWGELDTSFIAFARPTLTSLRAMAAKMDEGALAAAIDVFDDALADLVAPGAPPVVTGDLRLALLQAYASLGVRLPQAFALEGERDRREPIIVRALLGQVPGLEGLTLEKLLAAGLGRLESLLSATADEIAVVADVPRELAAAVAAQVDAFRRATPAPLAALDAGKALAEIEELAAALRDRHAAFEAAAESWAESSPHDKRRLRRQRELCFMQIQIALARLGEVDRVLRLDRLPFATRIAELDRFLERRPAPMRPAATAAPAPAPTPAPAPAPVPAPMKTVTASTANTANTDRRRRSQTWPS